MAWTTPTALALISDDSNIYVVMDELKTALFERQDALGLSRTTGWSASEHIATRMASYFEKLTEGISALYDLFYPSGLSAPWASVQAVVEAAGYIWSAGNQWVSGALISGTPSSGTLFVSRRETWIELQDIFSELIYYRDIRSGSFFATQRRVANFGNSTPEATWADCLAATPIDSQESGGLWYHGLNSFGKAHFAIAVGGGLTIDLSDLSPEIHGEIIAFNTPNIVGTQTAEVNKAVTHRMAFDTFEVVFPANTNTTINEPYSFSLSSVNAAMGSQISSVLVITTDETDDPFDPGYPASYHGSHVGFGAATAEIFFDITPALTYG